MKWRTPHWRTWWNSALRTGALDEIPHSALAHLMKFRTPHWRTWWSDALRTGALDEMAHSVQVESFIGSFYQDSWNVK